MNLIEDKWNWRFCEKPEFGFMDTFSKNISNLEKCRSIVLPDIRWCRTLFLGSDYGGEHQTARYQVLAYLLVCLDGCVDWESKRSALRNRFLKDGRRISYKNLGDKKRQIVLPRFLKAADSIPGLLFVLLIDKNIESLFQTSGKFPLDSENFKEFSHWNVDSFEKLMRVVHFASFFVAGLSAPYQDLLWFTDEDAIVPNDDRLYDVVEIFKRVSSHYLQHNLKHIKIGTTRSDTGKRDIEDLVSIPDLVSGAICEIMSSYKRSGDILRFGFTLPRPDTLSAKALYILNWVSENNHPLKRFVYSIDEIKNSKKLNMRHIKFHDVLNVHG